MITAKQIQNCQRGLVDCGDGIKFNMSLYGRIRKAREKAGLPVANINIDFDHPLLGRQLKNKKTGVVYTVKSCKKQWQLGWFYGFTIEQASGSGTFLWWELDKKNPSKDSHVVVSVNRNQEKMQLLPDRFAHNHRVNESTTPKLKT